MDLLSILALAAGLAADATAVSIAAGLTLERFGARHVFRMAFHFGLFQAGMPLLGWLGGTTVEPYVRSWDHWVAAALLMFVGGKMIVEALRGKEEGAGTQDPTRGFTLVLLSLATSIDAMAVGLSLGLMSAPILVPAAVIGVVTTCLSASGMVFGRHLGLRFGRGMAALGGGVLLAIAARILFTHLR